MAVGQYIDNANDMQTLTELLSAGVWTIVPSPELPTTDGGESDNELNGVDCTSATACIAVGDGNDNGGDSGTQQALAESWNGSTWTVMPTPDVGTGANQLASVTCTSATACVAVGSASGVGQTLVETWNGTTWSVVPSPTPTGAGGYLAWVSCADADDCMAVGSSDTGTDFNTLAESWNGSDWSIVTTLNGPTPGTP